MVVAFAFAGGVFESVRSGLVGAGSGRRIMSLAGVAEDCHEVERL